MKITNIHIKNYKSIKELDINPNPKLNVFIGENGVGKSNIFDAINWLLGPNYPTFNATTEQDHYLGVENNKILIQLYFEDDFLLELNESKDKYQFSIERYGTYQKDLSPLREKFCSAYVGVERQIVDYLPSNRWSLLGRILLEVNKKFLEERTELGERKSEKLKQELDKIRDNLLFSVADAEGNNIMQRFISILQEESANQMNKKIEDFQLNFNLYDPWNFYKTLQILVNEPDIELTFQASQLGMGAQAAITIAILRAYSEIKLGGGNPIFIDEPELFLHPQAQRNFYKILRKLAEENDIQIFYITHSPYLISLEHFDESFVVRKTKERGTYIRNAEVDKVVEDLKIRKGIDSNEATLKLHYKNAYEQTADSLSSLEAFFAKKVILVEGGSEALILPYFFGEIPFDYIKEKITIVKCGGRSELDRFYRLYSEFGIPSYVIFDGDRHHRNEDLLKSIRMNRELFDVLGETKIEDFPDGKIHENYFGFEYDFNHALKLAGFEGVYNEGNPERSPKGLDLFLKVKEQVENSAAGIPDWISQIRENIINLPEEVDSVLKQRISEKQSGEYEDLQF
jgi:putative ATP-dependent endonuclease of OLD family